MPDAQRPHSTSREAPVVGETEGASVPPLKPQRLRHNFRTFSPVLGTFVMLPRIEVVEIAAIAGFGAVVFDLEHGSVALEDLPPLCAAASAKGIVAIARIGSHADIEVSRALDMGVDGVIVPHVSSPAAAHAVADAGRFPPAGARSLNPYVRGLAYNGTSFSALSEANSRTALVAMIEGTDALQAAHEIGDVQDIDALFLGPVDLAGALGFPGDPEHPEVLAAARTLIATLRERGIATAIYAPDALAANRWLAEGVTLVVVSADQALMLDAFSSLRRHITVPTAAAHSAITQARASVPNVGGRH